MEGITKEELIAFEDEVVKRFLNREFASPCHLSGGNEEWLIEIFKQVKPEDWVFTTYRSHYHALLKGMPREELMKQILDNKSMHIMSKEHKIVTTAIVGSTISQAVGCAMAIKRKKEKYYYNHGYGKLGEDLTPHVWVFLGDMASTMGVFWECWNYAEANNLPITFIIENNKLSTDTPTKEAWGLDKRDFWWEKRFYNRILSYEYERVFPHYGVSERGFPEKRIWVDFDKEMKT